MERFWSKVDKTGDCWIWKASLTHSGYGQFYHQGGPVRAHRLSYEMEYGPIPNGMYVLHSCDTPACVNPKHLSVGTQKDNLEDMKSKGRGNGGPTPLKEFCKRGHRIGDNPSLTKDGRRCRTCAREYARAYRKRIKV
jgi:hypothetical protein